MYLYKNQMRGLSNSEIDENFLELSSLIGKYENCVFVCNTKGNDSGNTGSDNSPFKTITAALNYITDASYIKPYKIYIKTGTYTENVVLKPFIGVYFDNTTTLQGHFVIDSSDSSGSDIFDVSGNVNVIAPRLLDINTTDSFSLNFIFDTFASSTTSTAEPIISINCDSMNASNINIKCINIRENNVSVEDSIRVKVNGSLILIADNNIDISGTISIEMGSDSKANIKTNRIIQRNKSTGTLNLPMFLLKLYDSMIDIRSALISTQTDSSGNNYGIFNTKGSNNSTITYSGEIKTRTSVINNNGSNTFNFIDCKIDANIDTTLDNPDGLFLDVSDGSKFIFKNSFIKYRNIPDISDGFLFKIMTSPTNPSTVRIDNVNILFIDTLNPIFYSVSYDSIMTIDLDVMAIYNSIIIANGMVNDDFLEVNDITFNSKILVCNGYTNITDTITSGFEIIGGSLLYNSNYVTIDESEI